MNSSCSVSLVDIGTLYCSQYILYIYTHNVTTYTSQDFEMPLILHRFQTFSAESDLFPGNSESIAVSV